MYNTIKGIPQNKIQDITVFYGLFRFMIDVDQTKETYHYNEIELKSNKPSSF